MSTPTPPTYPPYPPGPPPPYGAVGPWPQRPERKPSPVETWLRERLAASEPSAAAPRRVLLLAAGVGVICDLMLHAGIRGFGLSAVFVALGLVVVASGGARSTESRLWLGSGLALGVLCTLRASGWVEAPLAAVALLALFVAGRPVGSRTAFDAGWSEIVPGWIDAAIAAVLSPPWLAHGMGEQMPIKRHVLPGVAVALGLVALLGGLLASADPVFASLFKLDGGDVALHAVLVATGVLLGGWLVRRALSSVHPAALPLKGWLSPTDVTIALGAVTALFAVFVATQVAVATGVAAGTLRAQGITFSDYARSGYFQLLAVVAVVAVILPWARLTAARGSRRQHRAVGGLSLAVVALTAAILCVAVRRLSLYDDAYGLTLLRLSSLAGAVFMACLLVLLAASALHSSGRWLPAAALFTLMVTVAAFAVINPEATVARYNLGRSGPVPLDRDYLLSLSSDATPDIFAAVGSAACSQVPGFDWRMWTFGDVLARSDCG